MGDHVALLLAGMGGHGPQTLSVPADRPVLVVGRGFVLDHDEVVQRVRAACRGALWLARHNDSGGMPTADLRRLLVHHAHLSGCDPQAALRLIFDGMPDANAPSLWRHLDL